MKAPSAMREKIYSDEEIVALLIKAQDMGLNLKKGSELEDYTIGELERLVTQVQ